MLVQNYIAILHRLRILYTMYMYYKINQELDHNSLSESLSMLSILLVLVSLKILNRGIEGMFFT